jgi:RNA polymerase sigma-70 factor (ECF subfamily)
MALDFATVYDQQVSHVYGFFAYRLNNRSDAEDLTQVTFERALKAWPRYDPLRSAPGTWLLAIARNILIDHFRTDRSRHNIAIDGSEEGERMLPPVSQPEYDEGLDPSVAAAIETLSARDREIVALRFGGDLSGPEIAALTGLTLANVQQVLSRSLRKLRAELDDAGFER